LPIYQFSKTVGLLRDIRGFLRIEAGTTRGNTPDDIRRKQARKLEAARRTIEETRKQLAQKERQLDQRGIRTPGSEALTSTRKAESRIEFGALPDFLIIGTEKGGTTFLYWTLCQHPYVEPATEKELHFFDTRKWFKRDVGWYRSQFPAPTRRDGQKVITGEASPYYLFHPFSPRRASTILPNVKLIALLRNPVDRAYSAYNHKAAAGQEPLSFEEALAEEEKRTAGELEKMLADERYYSSSLRKYAYRSRGIYVDQLQRWHKYFAPNQLLVLKSEDLFADPVGTVGIVHQFLNLPKRDMSIPSSAEERNSRSYSPMAPATRQRLEQFFEPHNQRLYEYLDVDVGWQSAIAR
jgi:Sulfotransferase domain